MMKQAEISGTLGCDALKLIAVVCYAGQESLPRTITC